MIKREVPWVDGPWHAEFRHIVGHSDDKNHPMRSWPDCTGEKGDGEWDCDTEGCEFSEDCKGEWEEFTPRITVTYLKNPGKMTQGDQVVHPIVDANAQLIALAPEMAEAILKFGEWANKQPGLDPQEEEIELLAERVQKIIDEAKRREISNAKWKVQQGKKDA